MEPWFSRHPARPEAVRLSHVFLAIAGWLVLGSAAAWATTNSFTNSNRIIMTVGGSSLYPSPIVVSNMTGLITRVTARLASVSHANPDDMDVLLVAPGGQEILLMSDAGGTNDAAAVTLTFSNASPALLPDSTQIVSGIYRPTDYSPGEAFPAPAPAAPYLDTLASLNGTSPNGTWNLYVFDDSNNGWQGEISLGWSLQIEASLDPPVITNHPQSQAVSPGAIVTFSVGVTGTPPFGYQWLRNGQVIVPFGQGSDSLTLSNVQAPNAGLYSVVVTNIANLSGVTSSNATLNVTGPLTLVTPLTSQTNVEAGSSVTFYIGAAGTPPIHYQWHLNGVPLAGETNATLSRNNLQPTNGGAFSVLVFNESQSEYLLPPPALLKVPVIGGGALPDNFASRPSYDSRQGTLQGNSASATAETNEPYAEGGGKTVWMEWQATADGIATFQARGSAFDTMLSVFTGDELGKLELVTRDDDRGGFHTSELQFNAQGKKTYQIMLDGFDIAGTGGEYTLSWSLEETPAQTPVILAPPMSTAVLKGSNAVFQVLTTNQPGLSYQWYFNDAPITGETQSMLTLIEPDNDDVGFYFVRLRSSSGRELESRKVDLQIATTAGALMTDKLAALFQTSANGNRPGGGFIAIGLGGTDIMNAPITNSAATNGPCIPAFSTKFRYRGLEATNNGVIFTSTTGSPHLMRAAVYREPMSIYTNALDCDTTSWQSGQPARLKFNATNTFKYTVVCEIMQTNGPFTLTSAMGIAPPVTNAPKHHFVPQGGSLTLTQPATNWVPLPNCQWLRDGQIISGALSTNLALTNFSAVQSGTYSVIMSNFVRVTTNIVAIVDLAPPMVLGVKLGSGGGGPAFLISATNTAPFVLLTTTNLAPPSNWVPLHTNQDSAFSFSFTNANILAEPRRFFRTVLWP